MLHASPRARSVFAACWVSGQAALVLVAPARVDGALGFRMFPEASTIEIRLWRDVGGERVAAPHGEWTAADRAGRVHEFSWRDRVRDPVLGTLGARAFAAYGVGVELARLQRALDDVAAHTPDDAQTRCIGAYVTVWKNGREPVQTVLSSHARPGA